MNEQTIVNHASATDAFSTDVMAGLAREQKTLPCKYLYDETGSKLFDRICELDEYYPTRVETAILRDNAESIAAQIGRQAMLVEPGSGSSVKTRVLLDALLDPVAYVPVDISAAHLRKTAVQLRERYPAIEVLPVAADFTRPFPLPQTSRPYSHRALFFPGSTIGNFEPAQAAALMDNLSRLLGPGGGLLIGIDLQKDTQTIEAAYNDKQGVTARFNLNLLTRINRELAGDFDLDRFAHQAVYDHDHHRVVISIVSEIDQDVCIDGQTFHFDAGEEILTEYSHKYTIDGFATRAQQHGFRLHRHWTDRDKLFGVLHLVLDESTD